ncbi:MAG: pectate lyase [Armatimonadota bacterium]
MRTVALIVLLAALMVSPACALDQALVQQAAEALRQATQYLTENAAIHGGYAGSYLADLSDQWGEGHISSTMNWVQPPGSPSTGFAFLAAYEATGDEFFLQAARQVADSLVWGQLACGGWDYNIDFSPEGEQRWFYRHNVGSANPALTSGRNVGTMDDNVTQHATRLLMAVDMALDRQDAAIHEATMAALEFLLEAQGDDGGWPQRYPLAGRGYGDFVTLNDNTLRDCADVMMIAWRNYGDQRYYDAVVRCGEFLIKAQLPEPQATWAQQYDADLRPAWARRFEPPAACGGESFGAMRQLMDIALFTGEERFLAPLPAAMDWFERSRLPNGRWARFYELKTNRPLYFYAETYRLTYDSSNVPTHYSFEGGYYNPRIREEYDHIVAVGLEAYQREREQATRLTDEERIARAEGMEQSVRDVLAARNEDGVWLRRGGYGGSDVMHLDMQTVQSRMRTLSEYVRLARGR